MCNIPATVLPSVKLFPCNPYYTWLVSSNASLSIPSVAKTSDNETVDNRSVLSEC